MTVKFQSGHEHPTNENELQKPNFAVNLSRFTDSQDYTYIRKYIYIYIEGSNYFYIYPITKRISVDVNPESYMNHHEFIMSVYIVYKFTICRVRHI